MHNLVIWKVIASKLPRPTLRLRAGYSARKTDKQTTMKTRLLMTLLMSLLLAFGLFGTAQATEPTQLTSGE